MLLLLLVAAAVSVGAKGVVDEELLVPHALDASETSDREILESLNADDETTTTTTTTTTSTTTTTAAPTTDPASRFSVATRALLESYHFNATKIALAGLSETRARGLVRRLLQKRALARARAEELRMLKRARLSDRAKARARKLAARRRRLALLARKAREAKRKAADYIPAPLKRAMKGFGLSWRRAEAEHEPLDLISKDVKEKADEEAQDIAAEEKREEKAISAAMALEVQAGLKEPLEEERRVAEREKAEERKLVERRSTGRRHELRVMDTVRRRQERLQRRLQQDEIAIEQRAHEAEVKAEQQAAANAAALRSAAEKDIELTETRIVKEASRAARVSKAAQDWLQDQQEPAIAAFLNQERTKLEEKLQDVAAKARVRRISLRRKLRGIN
jgi:hypothetical protein